MKLLFNNTTDLKELLGFLDADLTFDNFKTDLQHATSDVIKLIGKDTYNKIEAHFSLATPFEVGANGITEEQMDDLVAKAQLPIALFANLAIESNTDLSHTNSGRTVKVSDQERQPWEWQIDKDNAAQRRRAYKALDLLIEELDELKLDEWTLSDEYLASKEYFIHTVDLFEAVYPINKSRQLYLRLIPFMADVEEEFIFPVIGALRFDALKEKILDDDLLAADKILLKKINKVIGYMVLADSYKALPVEMFPDAVINYRETGKNLSDTRAEVMTFFATKSKYHLAQLEKHISALDVVDTEIKDPITGMEAGTKFINL